jgi:multimeric flavodoxin WrbA
MQILAFNGSPRKKGNTSTIIAAILEGARSKGAQTTEVRLHDINLRGCMGSA